MERIIMGALDEMTDSEMEVILRDRDEQCNEIGELERKVTLLNSEARTRECVIRNLKLSIEELTQQKDDAVALYEKEKQDKVDWVSNAEEAITKLEKLAKEFIELSKTSSEQNKVIKTIAKLSITCLH
tara:strand:+ start:3164 stop:3547 length:384 start_codon:yes stop_codon:yes gene_type:complete